MDFLITICAEYIVFLVILGAAASYIRLKRQQRLEFTLLLASAGLLAFLLSLLAAKLHYEPRPFVTEHVKPLIAHGTDNGFPSDHALLTMVLTASMYFYRRKIALLLLLGTILTGLGRVLADLHSPQQIVAGWVIAIVSVLTVRALQQVWSRRGAVRKIS